MSKMNCVPKNVLKVKLGYSKNCVKGIIELDFNVLGNSFRD
jgi:hypothetical protein